jgi:hypothetical protein
MKLIVCLSLMMFPTFISAQDASGSSVPFLIGDGTSGGGQSGGVSLQAALSNAGLSGGGVNVGSLAQAGLADSAVGGAINVGDTDAASSTSNTSSAGTN